MIVDTLRWKRHHALKLDFSIGYVGMKSFWILSSDGFVLLRILTRWKCPGLIKAMGQICKVTWTSKGEIQQVRGSKGISYPETWWISAFFYNTKAWRHGEGSFVRHGGHGRHCGLGRHGDWVDSIDMVNMQKTFGYLKLLRDTWKAWRTLRTTLPRWTAKI